jgi:hypothetical protein
MIPGFAEFEFDLPAALLVRLLAAFEDISPVPLTTANVAAIPDEQGVYQLFLKREGAFKLVYIGKTDGDAGLNKRLGRHSIKIQSRANLDPADVLFKAVRIFVFTAIDLETQLIRHYSATENVSWNGSGFGSNDPGRERDTTTYKADHFDTQFPIDLSRVVPEGLIVRQESSAADILWALKRGLPYLIRFETQGQNSRRAHADLENTTITLLPNSSTTARDIIEQIIRHLPSGWHATLLPSHVIIYKNDTRNFPSGTLIARSGT